MQAAAIAWSEASAARTNEGRSRRSSGGYPVTASSGKRTSSAPCRRASARAARMRSRLPSRSPTTTLIWASASRTTRSYRFATLRQKLRCHRAPLPRARGIGERRLCGRTPRGLPRRPGRGDAASTAAVGSASRGRSRRRSSPVARRRRPRGRSGSRRRRARAPAPVSWDGAVAASSLCVAFEADTFRGCFSCGQLRAEGDGLRIFPGRSKPGDPVSSPWIAHEASVPVVWAAIDCSGAYALSAQGRGETVLGRMAARIERLPAGGERCIVMGWSRGEDGRKLHAGTALWTAEGELPRARPPDLDRPARDLVLKQH